MFVNILVFPRVKATVHCVTNVSCTHTPPENVRVFRRETAKSFTAISIAPAEVFRQYVLYAFVCARDTWNADHHRRTGENLSGVKIITRIPRVKCANVILCSALAATNSRDIKLNTLSVHVGACVRNASISAQPMQIDQCQHIRARTPFSENGDASKGEANKIIMGDTLFWPDLAVLRGCLFGARGFSWL